MRQRTMRHLGRLFVLGGLLLPAAPSQAASKATPQRRGEAFTFSLKLGPLEGGRARLSIPPPAGKDANRLIHVVGEAEAVGLARIFTKLHDGYKVTIDADTLLPRTVQVVETGIREQTVDADILQGGPTTQVDVKLKRQSGDRIFQRHLPSEIRDPVASLLVMRAQPLRNGDRMDFLVLDGAAFYKGWVEVVGRKEITTVLGTRRAIELRCRGRRLGETANSQKPPREVTLWLSDDVGRVPLRMEGETDLGLARIELTSHEAPRVPLPAPRRLPGVTRQE